MYFGSCGDQETVNLAENIVFQLLKEYLEQATKKIQRRMKKLFILLSFLIFLGELIKTYTHNFRVEIQKIKIQGVSV